jgi:hypothetical protein
MGVADIEVQSPSPYGTTGRANDAKATAFSGRGERVAPLGSLSSMTRGASRDSRRYRRIRSAIWKKLSRQRYSRGSGLSFPVLARVLSQICVSENGETKNMRRSILSRTNEFAKALL